MSKENVELVQREYAAVAVREWATLTEIWHPEIK